MTTTPWRPAILVVVLLSTVWLHGQTASTQKLLEFEVASIKRHESAELGARVDVQSSGRVVWTNLPISAFVLAAYGLAAMFQVAGAPEWSRTERYDIVAKAPEGIALGSAVASGTGPPTPLQEMMRSLLRERFNFSAHVEQRGMPGYALLRVEPSGLPARNLTPSHTDCAALRAAQGRAGTPPQAPGERRLCGMSGTAGSFSGGAITIGQFVTMFVAPRLGKPVVDRTELQGTYDIFLTFRPERPPDGSPAEGGDDAADWMTALREQLGLRVQSTITQSGVLVIERLDRPTPN